MAARQKEPPRNLRSRLSRPSVLPYRIAAFGQGIAQGPTLHLRTGRLAILGTEGACIVQASGRHPQKGPYVARSVPSMHPPCSLVGSDLPVLWRSVSRRARSHREARTRRVASHVGFRERRGHGRRCRGMQRAARIGLPLRRTPRTRRCRAKNARACNERHGQAGPSASLGFWGETVRAGGGLWSSSELLAATHGRPEKEAVTQMALRSQFANATSSDDDGRAAKNGRHIDESELSAVVAVAAVVPQDEQFALRDHRLG
jgi:hypothetical protein